MTTATARFLSFITVMMIFRGSAHASEDCAGRLFHPLQAALHEVWAGGGAKSARVLLPAPSQLDQSQLGPVGQEILARLDQLLVGHRDVKLALAQAVQRAATGTHDPRRPVGVFLLMGVTGTGKSLTADALAAAINGDPDAKLSINGGEIQEDHEVAKITSAPAGFVGHDKTPPLISDERLRRVTSARYNVNVVLIDELEKASPDLQRLLLGPAEKATMTIGTNESVDFSHTILLMTSNLGQEEMQKILRREELAMGFHSPRGKTPQDQQKLEHELEEAALNAAQLHLAPEFRNRIDQTFVFKPLSPNEAREVVRHLLASLQARVFRQHKVGFWLEPEAIDFVLKNQYRAEFGGRSVRRGVDRGVADPLTNLISSHQIEEGDMIGISLNVGQQELVFEKVATSLSIEDWRELFQKFYGPQFLAALEDIRADVEPQYRLERFPEYLSHLDAIDDTGLKLELIRKYIENSPTLTDRQFLNLLKRSPADWRHGTTNSDQITQQLSQLKLGEWASMSFEPTRLWIFWNGLSRVKFLSPTQRRAMNATLGLMLNETNEYFKSQPFNPEFVRDVLILIQTLHATVMNRPQPPGPQSTLRFRSGTPF